MPELPEVENVRLSLEKYIVNKQITDITINHPAPIKYNEKEEFLSLTKSKVITELERMGKFLILTLKNKDKVNEHDDKETNYLICHLGMTGAFLYNKNYQDYNNQPPTIGNHIHVSMKLNDNEELFYSDYRRFGSLRVITFETANSDAYPSHLKTLFTLGVDAVSESENAVPWFIHDIRQPRYRHKPIKDVLLDQRVVAGIGNIYASECLFPNGINPYTEVEDVTNEQLEEIFKTNRDIMNLSIKLGGSSIKDYVNGEGVSGSFQDHLKVYDQQFCQTCNTPIEKSEINKRATYHCPNCQPYPYEEGE